MRPKHQRHELLEDIFAPEQPGSAGSAEDIVRLVHAALRARQRRRRILMSSAIVAVAGICAAALWPERPAIMPTVLAQLDPAPSAPVIASRAAAPAAPRVEHVDDEGMLAMLDDRPAALVRWPDGRQRLLLLVAQPARD